MAKIPFLQAYAPIFMDSAEKQTNKNAQELMAGVCAWSA